VAVILGLVARGGISGHRTIEAPPSAPSRTSTAKRARAWKSTGSTAS